MINRTRCLPILCALLLQCSAAWPFTSVANLGDAHVSVYAPSWTWQKQDLNILLVVANNGSEPARLALELVPPGGAEDHFTYPDALTAEVEVPPGGTVRHAFTNITALDDVPRQTYTFQLIVENGDTQLNIPYPVRTIRGAAVNPGAWAAVVPAGLAAAWCIVFVLVLGRKARAGAWKTPGPPIDFGDDSSPDAGVPS